MKRRSFLKAVLGVLVAPCLPQVKVAKKIEFRKWATLKAPAMPLVEGIAPNFGWKVWQVTRILNDSFVRTLETNS